MNVFDYAIKIEQEGEQFYRDLAKRTNHIGLKAILTILADEEILHDKMFANMRDNLSYDVHSSTILTEYDSMITSMKTNKEKFDVGKDEVGMFEKALKFEKDSVEYYTQKAKESTIPNEKLALLKIAAEEQKHVIMIENLIEHISKPFSWIEDAEMSKKEPY